MSICLAAARAEASRRNGAKSRGPRTPEGKARSAQNALKHGLCATRFAVVGDESAAEFAALEAELAAELAPNGALQGLLAGRMARAAWRLERAERIEAELFARRMGARDLGLALIRDGHGARAFDTLLRYRGTALAELWRALRLLKALQAEAAHASEVRQAAPAAALPGRHAQACPPEKPIEPESRTNPGETASVPTPAAPDRRPDADADRHATAQADPARPHGADDAAARPPHRRGQAPLPIEPEAGGNRGDTARRRPQTREGSHLDALHPIAGRATGRVRTTEADHGDRTGRANPDDP